jgi:type II secretory pathway pseudopilin PulG
MRTETPPRRAAGYISTKVLALLVVLAFLAALLLPALARVRELSRRSKSGKLANQLVTAQNAYAADQNQKGKVEAYVRGTEGFCQPDGRPAENWATGSDSSRAFVGLAKKGFIDQLSALANPGDPFVAALDSSGWNIDLKTLDLPEEGKAAPQPWASPQSVAAVEAGHTFFSYGFQSGNGFPRADLTPKLSPKIPLVADRNPYSVAAALGLGDPTHGSAAGNPWSHNREGFTTSYTDGHNQFLTAANEIELPVSPKNGAALGFDYLYNDEEPAQQPAFPPKGGSNPKAGEAAYGAKWGAWVTD